MRQSVVKLWQNKTTRLFVPYSNFTSSPKLPTLPLMQASIYNCFCRKNEKSIKQKWGKNTHSSNCPPLPKLEAWLRPVEEPSARIMMMMKRRRLRERKSLFIRNSRLELHSIRALTPHHTPGELSEESKKRMGVWWLGWDCRMKIVSRVRRRWLLIGC